MHTALESRIGFDMRIYKEYIDNEILVTMAQMDKPSKIFDYLYLVSVWVVVKLTTIKRAFPAAEVNKLTEISFRQNVVT